MHYLEGRGLSNFVLAGARDVVPSAVPVDGAVGRVVLEEALVHLVEVVGFEVGDLTDSQRPSLCYLISELTETVFELTCGCAGDVVKGLSALVIAH